jgi:hypothetical protein
MYVEEWTIGKARAHGILKTYIKDSKDERE